MAIRGERHDGHGFVGDVREKGVSGFVVAQQKLPEMPVRQWAETGVFCAAVPETTSALGALAAFHRERAGVRVVAITGSNGKTTTRAMTASVMERRHRILATPGNLNNEIGLPLTLFRLDADHEWAVVELGMNHAGEIRRLARICRPDVGIITNIGPAHLKGLGSLEGVAAAKGELWDEMGRNATAILNVDDPHCRRLAEDRPFRVVRFGLGESAEIRGLSLETAPGGIFFILRLPEVELPVRLKVPGRFMVMNALAAAAVGWVAGIPPEEIVRGVEGFQPVAGRMGVTETRKRITLVNDTYNANPHSMRAAIDAFAALRGGGRGVLVLGDMFELGASAFSLHRAVGEWAAESGVRRLCVTGEFAPAYLDGALKKGMAASDMVSGTKAALVEDLKQYLAEGDWVLVKGSRGMAMETLFNDLRNWADAGTGIG